MSVTDTGGRGQAARRPCAMAPRRAHGGSGVARRPSGGFGLAGIAERVASCGGSLTVGPVAEGGFAVTARLPTP